MLIIREKASFGTVIRCGLPRCVPLVTP